MGTHWIPSVPWAGNVCHRLIFSVLVPFLVCHFQGSGISKSSTTTCWHESLGADLLPQTELLWLILPHGDRSPLKPWDKGDPSSLLLNYLETRKVNNSISVFLFFSCFLWVVAKGLESILYEQTVSNFVLRWILTLKERLESHCPWPAPLPVGHSQLFLWNKRLPERNNYIKFLTNE